jgi:lysozyme
MKTGYKGQELIKSFESLKLKPYLCSSDIATIGWGHLILDPITRTRFKGTEGLKKAIELYPKITEKQALEWLKSDLSKAETEVNKLIKVELNQNQFDSLVSFVFNCGVSETLFKYINTKPLDDPEIGSWWKTHYITSNGIIKNGLIRRRKAEYELFSTGRLNLI